MMVQMVATDLRIRVESLQRISERLALGRRASSKFDLELHLALQDRLATDCACRAGARAGEHATRSRRWQSAALDRFAGFRSEDCLVGHRSLPHIALPVHAQRVESTVKDSPIEDSRKLPHLRCRINIGLANCAPRDRIRYARIRQL